MTSGGLRIARLAVATLTFLFTDVEGSTRLWEQHPEQMRLALIRHDRLIEEFVTQFGGAVVRPRGEGDSRFAVFEDAPSATSAACAIQRALRREPWPTPQPLRVRMAIHTGLAELRDGDYYGTDVNRCARLRGVAHAGQVLLSARAADRASTALLPAGVTLRGLGQHRLKDLGEPEWVYQLLHPELPAEFPPLKSLSSLLNNLPVESTSFVGRELEMAEVKRLVHFARLVTITGAGGAGKTRLALHVAADLLDDFEDGVWLVELARLTDPTLVLGALASAVGVREEPAVPLRDLLLDALRPKQALIILDNCEHLIHASAEVADLLIRTCPHVRIVATSREALRIAGESAWRVPSLSLPNEGRTTSVDVLHRSQAASLFLERAFGGVPDIALSEGGLTAVAAICRRLDGIPLALELAAARARVLSPEQIAERLADRFRLLTDGNRVAPRRHQTLKALVDWSYDLLSEPERALFMRLAVFAGNADLEAAEHVCTGNGIPRETVLDLLSQLLDKSLVIADQGVAGPPRYHMLETLRQYGRERLEESGEYTTLRQAHAAYFLELAERARPELGGPHQAEWLRRLEVEHDNLLVAMGDAAERPDPATGLRLVAALGRFWESHGHLAEGAAFAERVLARSADVDPHLRAAALLQAGVLAWRQGDLEHAHRRLGQSLALSRAIDNRPATALVLNNLGNIAFAEGDYARARQRYEESLALRRELGDLAGEASCLNNLGIVASDLGDYDEAREKHEQSLALRRRDGNQSGIALSLQNLGEVSLRRGDLAEARQLYTDSLVLFRELGDRVTLARNLEALARVAQGLGQPARAARLFGASASLRETTRARLEFTDQATYERSLSFVRVSLGESAFGLAWAAGAALPVEAAIDEALSEEAVDRAPIGAGERMPSA